MILNENLVLVWRVEIGFSSHPVMMMMRKLYPAASWSSAG